MRRKGESMRQQERGHVVDFTLHQGMVVFPSQNHVYSMGKRYPLRRAKGGQVRTAGETKRGRWSDGLTLYPTFCHFPLPFPAFPMGSRPSSNSIPFFPL